MVTKSPAAENTLSAIVLQRLAAVALEVVLFFYFQLCIDVLYDNRHLPSSYVLSVSRTETVPFGFLIINGSMIVTEVQKVLLTP